jgi:hemerythrin-like domain-containing protein
MTGDTTATATSVLRDEHQLILEVAHELDRKLTAENEGDPLDYDIVARCITFFRLFADACHHGKEEDLLFPGLEAEGMPGDTGPIAMMLYEHEQGRALVRTMAASLESAREGDQQAGDDLRRAAEGFISLIVAHIGKEDNILFTMADGLIVGPTCRDLCARYDEVCARRFEGHTKQDLERLAGEILESTP